LDAQGFFSDEIIDIFDNPAWDAVRLKAQEKAIEMRSQGWSGAAMLPYSELEYGGFRDTLNGLLERFRVHGIAYESAEATKSQLYAELLPLLNSGRIELLDEPRLSAQLLALERRTAWGGRRERRAQHKARRHHRSDERARSEVHGCSSCRWVSLI